MPTYEYACSACGSEWEQTQRITEPPVEVCPKCAKSTAHRLISAGTNFILKGGGWCSDLYASPKADKADKADKSDKADKADKADKPAASDAPSPPAGGKSDATEKVAAKPASTESSSTTPGASSS